MKKLQSFKALAIAGLCASLLVGAVACSSSGASSSAASASASSAASADVSSAASEASAESTESSAASVDAASAEAASSEASAEASADAVSASAEPAPESASAEPSPSESAQSASATAAADAQQVTLENAESLGYQVFEGTVHVFDADELIEFQAIDIDPAVAGGGGTHAIVAFDAPCDVSAMSADGSGERTETKNMLGVAEYTDYESFVVEYGDLDTWKALDGQHVTIAAKAENMMFPSDVRLPINEPWSSETLVLQ